MGTALLNAPRGEMFQIAGPMGKGLMIDNNSTGLHFAFAAGTGVLVYIDLVARLLLQTVGNYPPENKMHPGFKFVLFASFDSR